MKVLIFSDTHLSSEPNPNKLNALKNIIRQCDQVIINGDFWDGYITSWNTFMDSEWKELFPLLKSKHCIYITGNHDAKTFIGNNYKLFAEKITAKCEIKSSTNRYIVEHGDRINPFLDSKFSNFLIRKKRLIAQWYKISKFFYNVFDEKIFRYFFRFINDSFINYIKKQKPDSNTYYIFSHTHIQENRPDLHFFNPGRIRHKILQYLVIENGEVKIFDERF